MSRWDDLAARWFPGGDGAGRGEPPGWYSLALAQGAPRRAEIAIYDDIGFWGISADRFYRELKGLGEVEAIDVLIDSNGGIVDDALAMFHMLRRHPAPVTVRIDAFAASAASLVAMAGDRVEMPENTAMFLHNPLAGLMGFYSAAALEEELSCNRFVRELMLKTYAARATIGEAEIGQLLDAATWLSAREAVDRGFADAVLPVSRMVARADLSRVAKPPPPALARRRFARHPTPSPSRRSTMPGFRPRAQSEDWRCGAVRDLPIAGTDAAWDGEAASGRMLDAAGIGGDSPDLPAARRGFLAFDADAPENRASYRLPFADLGNNGQLQAIPAGLTAAAQRLPQADIPEDVRSEAQAVLDAYGARMNPPDDGGGDGGGGQSAAARRERERAEEIVAACTLRGYPEQAAQFIREGTGAVAVRSILQSLPPRASGAGRGEETNPRHNRAAAGREGGSWDKAIARANSRFGDAR